MVKIYTDGSFNESSKVGAWCWYSPTLNIIEFGLQEMNSNNCAEKTAVLKCIDDDRIKYSKLPVLIFCDNEGIVVKFNKKTVRDTINFPEHISIQKVKGHSGVTGNILCDFVCRKLTRGARLSKKTIMKQIKNASSAEEALQVVKLIALPKKKTFI